MRPRTPGRHKAGPYALTAVLFLLAFPLQASAQEKPYDFVIKDALVFDGESLRPVKEDIAISGGRIVQLGMIAREEAREVVEAEGWAASPGFIDFHTHSDFNPFVYPSLGNKVFQGVTTEVVGNCGMSAAPVAENHRSHIADVWRREGVQTPAEIPWETFAEYRDEAELQGLDTNFAALVGHGNLRSALAGMEPHPLTPEQLDAIKRLAGEALDQGAFGVSFGLAYLPGALASREELTAVCREAGLRKKPCVFHIRSESSELTQAIQEALEIGKESGAPVHISHLKASGRKNWPKIEEVFQMIARAQAEGLRVTADAYPYTAGFAELGVILPEKFYRDTDRVGVFKDAVRREKLVTELREHFLNSPASWDSVRVATVVTPENAPLQGKSIQEIAQARGKDPVETLVELLAEEEFQVSAFYFSQSESIMERVLAQPYVFVGSDSIADGSAMPHPRAYGTFPKMLARCPREGVTHDPCWGKVIRQITSLPADTLGLENRGRIRPGAYADVVLFDPLQIRDLADYHQPKTKPTGIQWVFVNGGPAVRSEKYEPVHAGLFLTAEK